MEYWNSMLTEKSWDALQQLSLTKLKFTLIGGWAAYLWTRLQKSKDVDIVLDTVDELEALKDQKNISKNENLRKYEIHYGEIDVDVYVPYYSKLAIPPEDIHMHSTIMEGFKVSKPEALCILKQGAEEQRTHTVKGLKDRIDLMNLLCYTSFNYQEYRKLAGNYGHSGYPKRLFKIVDTFTEGKYLNYNPRQLKLKKKEILEKLQGKQHHSEDG